MQIFEPLLLKVVKHVSTAADAFDEEKIDLDLGPLDAILIYRVEFDWQMIHQYARTSDHLASNMLALSTDPDKTWATYDDARSDNETIAFLRWNQEAAWGTAELNLRTDFSGAKVWEYPSPIVVVNDMVFLSKIAASGYFTYVRIWFKRARLTEAEMATYVARRRS